MLRAKQLEREHDMIWRCELESRRMEVHFGEVEVNADMDSSTSTSQTVMTLEGAVFVVAALRLSVLAVVLSLAC